MRPSEMRKSGILPMRESLAKSYTRSGNAAAGEDAQCRIGFRINQEGALKNANRNRCCPDAKPRRGVERIAGDERSESPASEECKGAQEGRRSFLRRPSWAPLSFLSFRGLAKKRSPPAIFLAPLLGKKKNYAASAVPAAIASRLPQLSSCLTDGNATEQALFRIIPWRF